MINSSASGFFFLPDEGLAVIDWVMAQAQGGLLSGWKDYTGLSRANMKDRMDRHPDAIRPAKYAERSVMTIVKKVLPAASSHTISVLDISKLVAELTEFAPPMVVTPIETPTVEAAPTVITEGINGLSNI